MTTERAPEPTMDEILASIKRIISEEERGESREAPAHFNSPQEQAGSEFASAGDFPRAESQDEEFLIENIARALSTPEHESHAAGDDILDLTRVMEEELAAVGSAPATDGAAIPDDDDPFELGSPLREDVTGPSTSDGAGDASFEDDVFSLDEELSLETSSFEIPSFEPLQLDDDEAKTEAPAADAHADAPEMPATEIVPAADAASSNTDDPWMLKSALEEPEVQELESGRKEPVFGDASFAAPAADPDALSEAEAPGEPEAPENSETADAKADLKETEPEAAEEPTEESEFEVLIEETEVYAPTALVATSLADDHAAEMAEFEGDAPAAVEPAVRSLEDSVKDMLRPMLREWLNENMPRILEAALRDELQDGRLPKG